MKTRKCHDQAHEPAYLWSAGTGRGYVVADCASALEVATQVELASLEPGSSALYLPD